MSRRAATVAARHGLATDTQHGAVVPPLHLSSNFTFTGLGGRRRHDYTRSGNPTRDLLAEAIAELEGGASAVVTATGMAAITLVLQLVPKGGRVVAPHDGYGGTWRLLQAFARKGAFEVLLADLTDPAARAAALATRPSLVWIETPSNPLLRITDLAAACREAKAVGALVAVDNTFLSPLLQQPLRFGADVVVHSTTKYLNGHGDVVGGAVVAADRARGDELAWWANCLGLTGAPFDSWLTLRGVRTLPARLRVHEANAARIATWLAGHPLVARTFWPGLPTHPGHALARAQQTGFGAMVAFELVDCAGAAAAFVDGLACFTLAESLGGVESLVAHPATMTHAAMSVEARAAAGISDRLLRLSVGIEDGDDLVADLESALGRVARAAEISPAPTRAADRTAVAAAP
ncbi:MAG: cystathionine gamma-synthase [Planctomycetes bacterium]|nr:cystathionine gamma-synthase [Planctomycetota bacterium]